jgi:hypothetical protein
MTKSVGAVVAGFVAWLLVAGMLVLGLRLGWPAYAAAAPTRSYDLPMYAARLSISAAASLATGAVAARLGGIGGIGGRSALATGIVQLVLFVPYHIMIWDQYPVWYHLTFFVSLVPFALLGARLAGSTSR